MCSPVSASLKPSTAARCGIPRRSWCDWRKREGRSRKHSHSGPPKVAQDVTAEVADKCPWVDRYVVDSTDAPAIDSSGPYDVVSITHVIEHLTDPVGTLRRLQPVTRGMVFITAPHRPPRWDGTIESWRTYSYNHVPAHLQYVSVFSGARNTAGTREWLSCIHPTAFCIIEKRRYLTNHGRQQHVEL